MQTVTLTLAIDIDGKFAADVADDLGIDAEAGALDQAFLDVVRQHLRSFGDNRDWRIVRCVVGVQEGKSSWK